MTPKLIKEIGLVEYGKVGNKRRTALYLCPICSKEFLSQVYYVSIGDTTRCNDCKGVTHRLSNHKLYSIRKAMISRVNNKSNKNYINYGGRGIEICEEWADNFESFYEWSISNGYKEGLSIDRINNDGNYEPSNCRWTNRFIQSSNTRELKSSNTSGYRGICFDKQTRRWIAQIRINGKRKHLGRFDTVEEASIAYNKYREENPVKH